MTDLDFVRVARALADPTRLRILRTLAAGQRLCCGAICREVPVRPATMSHHLRILADAGLIETERDGQFINVCLNPARWHEMRDALRSFLGRPATKSGRPRSRSIA